MTGGRIRENSRILGSPHSVPLILRWSLETGDWRLETEMETGDLVELVEVTWFPSERGARFHCRPSASSRELSLYIIILSCSEQRTAYPVAVPIPTGLLRDDVMIARILLFWDQVLHS